MKQGKVWLVTGAGKGFGYEIVKAASASGDKVVATVRKESEKDIFDGDPNVLVLGMDVTLPKQVEAAVEKGIARFGGLDVIVNNAGFGIVGAIEEISDEETRKQYDTNVFGVLNVIRAVLPQLRKQRSGHIINISSLFAYDAIPAWALYGSTKFAVEGISVGLAIELAPFDIQVTALAPGLFRTNFLDAGSFLTPANPIGDYDKTPAGQYRNNAGAYHGNQAGDPAKLAKVVVALAAQEHPPLHLPVGLDSLQSYRNNAARTSREIEEWAGKFPATEV
ncbi:SDR family NAD(P)-dependent oxidoreductase [Puia dinghuensis]|uniref:Short-chain dehydrogenase/reductase n=1 Tax=Puia dinghuensis TaxID=1792502 RepID=A0A8J2UDV6_9BACT|nr:SDR family NAD(P)-dependent oxidoreductase [Puia dinghuensis]GGB02574.1 short-chain dehydrogenase/reductase [Puia dinghuensis]